MKAVLIRGKLIKLDEEDYHLVGNYRWCLNKGKENLSWYVVRGKRVNKKLIRVFLHRVVAGAKPGDRVSFIGNDTLDMRKKNLRKNGKRLI